MVVDTAAVRLATGSEVLETTGTVLPNERVVLVAELSRRLVRVRFSEGANVEQGQVLAELDRSDLEAEKSRLGVEKTLRLANETRLRALVQEGIESSQAYDEAKAQLQLVDARLEELSVAIRKCDLRAPFTGRVGLREVSEGSWVTPTTPITTMVKTGPTKVELAVPERHASTALVGATFEVLAEGHASPIRGTLYAADSSVSEVSRSLRARGELVAGEGLVPGSFVSVRLALPTLRGGMVVPARAIVPSARGQKVFVARDGKAIEVAVTVGTRTTDEAAVFGELHADDRVITSNLMRLRAGIAVVPAPPSSAPAPSPSLAGSGSPTAPTP